MAEVKKDETRFVIAIYVDNKFGVLTRVTSMFTRRGFNIDALTVGVTESPEYSRITLSMSGDGYARAQMLNQLRKLHNVKKVEILDEKDTIERELLLIKVNNETDQHQLIMSCVDIFKAKVLDVTRATMTLQITGENDKIASMLSLLEDYGILELVRTGIVALERGDGVMSSDIFD